MCLNEVDLPALRFYSNYNYSQLIKEANKIYYVENSASAYVNYFN